MRDRANTVRIVVRSPPGLREQLALFRDELAASRPGQIVTLADALKDALDIAVSSKSAGRATGGGRAQGGMRAGIEPKKQRRRVCQTRRRQKRPIPATEGGVTMPTLGAKSKHDDTRHTTHRGRLS